MFFSGAARSKLQLFLQRGSSVVVSGCGWLGCGSLLCLVPVPPRGVGEWEGTLLQLVFCFQLKYLCTLTLALDLCVSFLSQGAVVSFCALPGWQRGGREVRWWSFSQQKRLSQRWWLWSHSPPKWGQFSVAACSRLSIARELGWAVWLSLETSCVHHPGVCSAIV